MIVRDLLVSGFCAVLLLWARAGADELPSPDAVALGERVLPRTLIEGFREGVAREVLDATLGPRGGTAEEPLRRARARAALTPLLQEAFPPEFLAGVAAQLLARRYSAEELRALRAREDSPLGRKVRDLENRSQRAPDTDADAHHSKGEAPSPPTFSAAERKELETFAASPLGRKVEEVGPELAHHFLEALDQRWAQARGELEPQMRKAAEAAASNAEKGR